MNGRPTTLSQLSEPSQFWLIRVSKAQNDLRHRHRFLYQQRCLAALALTVEWKC